MPKNKINSCDPNYALGKIAIRYVARDVKHMGRTMSLNRFILASVVALLHVNAAIAQETTTQEPEVEAVVAKLEAMEDAKTWPYEAAKL